MFVLFPQTALDVGGVPEPETNTCLPQETTEPSDRNAPNAFGLENSFTTLRLLFGPSKSIPLESPPCPLLPPPQETTEPSDRNAANAPLVAAISITPELKSTLLLSCP